ncbi:MAG: hypothetical protein Kow0027_03160 [Saprospiraceae bacterium]
MNRVKKIAKWAFVLVLSLSILLFAAGLLFEEQIVKQLLSQLNEELTQPIEVEQASLSLLKDFPNASVSLRNVRLKDYRDSTLLNAGAIQFSFGLPGLINNEVVFDRIRIDQGELHLAIDKNGQPNYQILKTAPSGDAGSSSIFLQEALLTNLLITYTNQQLSQHFSQKVRQAEFSGSFAESAFALRTTADCYSDSIRLDERTFLKDMDWGYEAELYVDKVNKKLELNKVQLNIKDSRFNALGMVQTNEEGQYYDLIFSGNNFDLGTLLAATSDAAPFDFSDLFCEGKLQLDAAIKGQYSNNKFPEINGTMVLNQGELDHPRLYHPIKNATLTASFTNSAVNATGPTVFEISKLKGYVDKMPVEIFFRLENFENPYLDFIADGELPLAVVNHLLPDPPLTDADGSLIFRTLKFSGLASQITNPKSWGNVVMKGELACKDLAFEYKDKAFELPTGYFKFDDAQADLQSLNIKIDDSAILLSGTARNLLPVVFASLAGAPQNTNAIDFNVSIESENLDVKNVLSTILSEPDATEQEHASPNAVGARIIENLGHLLNGNITAQLQKFSYGKIKGEDFTGSLELSDNVLKIHGKAVAMEGRCEVESTIKLQNEPAISAKILFENINLKELFEQGNNLGQEFVRSEHVDGTLNGGALVYGNWDSLLRFDDSKLHILAGVKIDDGYLRNFDLLESFSDYVEIDDLRNVKFATLHNWLEYKNNTFVLPAMFVQNNAMNLTVCGTQTFDGIIDYNFKINGSQVLQKKLSARKFKGKLIPAKKDGFFNLYIHLTGTVDDFDYSLSKGTVKSALSKSETDRKRIRRIIFDAFGQRAYLFASGNELADFGLDEEFSDNDETEYIEGF